MKYVFIAAIILISFPLSGDERRPSRYAGVCGRRCGSGSRSGILVTVVDPVAKRRTHDRIYLYSSGNPAIVCQCHSASVRHRTRAEREITASLSRDCYNNCRAGTRLYPDVLIVEPDGREHRESISILQYNSPIGCICTGIPVEPPPPEPPRRHPER